MLLRLVPLLAVSFAVSVPALAASPEPRDNAPYQLPVVVHGKTSMRQAMRSNSTFSFKMFQQVDEGGRKPYSYPEPDSNNNK